MATARKLPSGSWRCQVFSHYEEVMKADGMIKKKRIYKSFVCDDPNKKGKKICEAEASDWALNKRGRSHEYNRTLKDAAKAYIKTKENVLSPATIIGYNKIVRNDFKPIENVKLDDFTRKQIQAWVNGLAENLSAKSVKNAHGLLSAVLAMHDVQGFRVKFPQEKKKQSYMPSDDDVKAILSASEGDLQIAIYLAAFAGLRRGEICALTDKDIKNGCLFINKSMGLKPDRSWEVKPPKTQTSNRTVKIPDFLYQRLSVIEGNVVKDTPDRITDKFGKLLKKLEIPSFRFHDLRHYFVSINHAIGVPDQYIMRQGGWATDGVMKRVYRNTINAENDKFAELSSSHFESMQHEMQHGIKKVP